MAVAGLALRAVLMAMQGPPSGYAVAAAGLQRFGPQTEFVRGAVAALNTLDTLAEIYKIAQLLHAIGTAGNDGLAREIVDLQRERGPDDTFRLERGTDWRREGDEIVITASAVRRLTSGHDDDYAWFVERGTDDTEAQPFFWDSAAERFAAWNRDMAQLIDRAASDVNAG